LSLGDDCAANTADYHVTMANATRASSRADPRNAPWVLDALLGLAVTLTLCVFIVANVGQTEPGGWPFIWAVGLGALMLVRRRYPILVVVVSVVAVIAYYAAEYPPIGVAVPLAAAVFSAAEFGRVMAAVIASAALIGISVAYRLAAGQDPALVVGYELPGHVLLLAGAIALGDGVRARRELRKQALEIAELVRERTARESEQRITSERLAIAREVHDSVGHALTVIALHAQVAEDSVGSDDAEIRRSLEVITETTTSTLTELRRTVAGLRHENHAPRSPLKLADLASAVLPAEQAGIEVGTNVHLVSKLSPTLETTIYRIIQESITNVTRHARASRVDVTVEEVDGRVRVDVVNDDRSTPVPTEHAVRRGNGITGMRERVQLLGGTFSAGVHGSGFAVRASIPLEVDS
jgi:signal transduction histidine kinase